MQQPDAPGENALDDFHELPAADQRAILNLLTADQRRRLNTLSRQRGRATASGNSPMALSSAAMTARIAEARGSSGDGVAGTMTKAARAALAQALGPTGPGPTPSLVQAVSGLLRSKGAP